MLWFQAAAKVLCFLDPHPQLVSHSSWCLQNLEKDVTTRMLHDTFSSFGNILSCKVALDKDLKSKGYGFVHFEDPSAATAAIEQVDGMRLGDSDKIVRVCEFLSRTERGDTKRLFTNLYVKNLPDSVQTKEELEKMFAEFGTISSAVIMKVQLRLLSIVQSWCHLSVKDIRILVLGAAVCLI
jgi:polyadenylate-binding protein